MIPDDVIEQVRSRAEVLEIVGEVVPLKRAGASYKGLCPFHGEKTPSFVVNPQQGTYHCFGCGAHGDSLKFIRETQHLNFPEAVRALAARVGVEVPEERPMSPKQRQAVARKRALEDRLFDTQEKLTRWYELALSRSEVAQRYLASRQVSVEAARTFRLGWAPNDVGALTRWMEQEEVPLEELEQLGVVISFDPDQPHKRGDARLRGGRLRFRDRLMCPIFDMRDRVVGFSGRVVDPNQKIAKYLNSPETPIFTKGDNVFGLKTARVAMTRAQHEDLILCEGNLDVIALWQAGIPNAVAAMGTAVTDQQAAILKRLTRSVICVMDGDAAGEKAAFKSLPILLARGLDVRGKLLPDGQDPDSFIKQHGGASFQSWLSDAAPLILVALESLLQRHPRDPIGQAAVARELIPLVALVQSEDQRPLFIDVIAKRLEIDRGYLTELLLRALDERSRQTEERSSASGYRSPYGRKSSSTQSSSTQSGRTQSGRTQSGRTQSGTHRDRGHHARRVGASPELYDTHAQGGLEDLPPEMFDEPYHDDVYFDQPPPHLDDQPHLDAGHQGSSHKTSNDTESNYRGSSHRGSSHRGSSHRGSSRWDSSRGSQLGRPPRGDQPWWTQVKIDRGPGRVYPRRFGDRPTGEAEIELAPTPKPPAPLSAQLDTPNPLRGYERETISFLFYHPELLPRFLESGGADLFMHGGVRDFLISLKSERDRGAFFTGELYFKQTPDLELVASLRDCIASPPPPMERVKPERKLDELMSRLRRSQLQLKLTLITAELKEVSSSIGRRASELPPEELSALERSRAALLERYQATQALISELTATRRSLSS